MSARSSADCSQTNRTHESFCVQFCAQVEKHMAGEVEPRAKEKYAQQILKIACQLQEERRWVSVVLCTRTSTPLPQCIFWKLAFRNEGVVVHRSLDLSAGGAGNRSIVSLLLEVQTAFSLLSMQFSEGGIAGRVLR